MDVGYALRWNVDGCRIEHPKHGCLPIRMVQGCPMVGPEWGKRLMEEMENEGMRRAHVRKIMECGVMAESGYEKSLAELRSDFPEVPESILERVPGIEDWSAECVPLNRRQRRKIDLARNVVVHAFAGEDQARWKAMETADTVVVCLDVKSGMNLHNPHVCGWINSLLESRCGWPGLHAEQCQFVGIVVMMDQCHCGAGMEARGLDCLSEWQQEAADGDSVLRLKNLVWMKKAQRMNPSVKLMLEQPQDPAEWKRSDGPMEYASFLVWPETCCMMKGLGLTAVRLQQGGLGHPTCKPTTLYTNMREIQQLEGCRSHASTAWPETAEERVGFSKGLAVWAPGLVDAVEREIQEFSGGCRIQALTAKQRHELDGYRRHCNNDHLPYRRDCAVCVESAGRDRARKKIQHPEAYCWSMDLAGPFRDGKDMEVHRAKYFMVHTVTIPVKDGIPLVQELRHRVGPDHQNEEDVVLDGADVERLGDAEQDPWELDGEQEHHVDIAEEDQAAVEAEEQKWKDYVQGRDAVTISTISWAVPLASRKADDVIDAAAQGYSRLRALGIPVMRVHADRAREFTGKSFRKWAAQRSLYMTFTAGDEPCGNARAEREIGHLKARVRVLLTGTASPMEIRPMALRHAARALEESAGLDGRPCASTHPLWCKSRCEAEGMVSARSGLEIPDVPSTMLWSGRGHELVEWRLCALYGERKMDPVDGDGGDSGLALFRARG